MRVGLGDERRFNLRFCRNLKGGGVEMIMTANLEFDRCSESWKPSE